MLSRSIHSRLPGCAACRIIQRSGYSTVQFLRSPPKNIPDRRLFIVQRHSLSAQKVFRTSRPSTLRSQCRSLTTEEGPGASKVTKEVRRSRILRFGFRVLAFSGGVMLFGFRLVFAFFVYDATTYRTDPDNVDIPVSQNALNPRRGGPRTFQLPKFSWTITTAT